MKSALVCTLAATLTVVSFGCDSDTVKVYHVARNDPPVVQLSAPSAEPASQSTDVVPAHNGAPASNLTYILPPGWKETAPGNMRAASFLVANPNGRPADLGVVPMPAAIPEIQLINMWRQQLQLPAAAGASADNLAAKVKVGDDEGKLYDLVSDALMVDNQARARILVAMSQRGPMNWFFKMVGEDSFVESQKPAFIQFLKSASIGGTAALPPTDLSDLPPAHPAIPGLNVAKATLTETNTASSGNPSWTVPAGWQAGQLSQFLAAKFVIAGDGDAKAEVNASVLAGAGGGLLANINRWRAQLSLGPVNPDDLDKITSTFEADGVRATLMDFNGTDVRTGKTARLVAVALPLNRQTWFFKLMGDEIVVARQKDVFIGFIKSAKYPHAN